MKTTDPPIIKVETYEITKSELWKAITEVDQMRQWFFEDIPAFEPQVGFETSFEVQAPSMIFTHTWKIIEVDPETKIVYDWSYPETVGRGTVSFELETEGNATKLTLTNITVEDWPQDMPEFKRESAEEGWTYFINVRLKEYIQGLKS